MSSVQQGFDETELKAQTEKFVAESFVPLGPILDTEKCKGVLDAVYAQRTYDGSIFLTEEEYRANPAHGKVNPGRGVQNLSEEMDLAFIEENAKFVGAVENALGKDYELVLKKFVCGVPESWMPEWLLKETEGLGVANLGGYIKPEYRNLTYFHGIDFHQDMIDFGGEIADMITVYVYLDEVGRDCSPLFVVPGSHTYGITTFPHDITVSESGETLTYRDDEGKRAQELPLQCVTGGGGTVAYWHGLTLHGTQPHTAKKERISLRYIFRKGGGGEPCALDALMANIEGELEAEVTRLDLADTERYLPKEEMRGNHINQVQMGEEMKG